MVRVVTLADTHDAHNYFDVPDGDIFIHAGSWTRLGGIVKIAEIFEWIESLPHKHKIIVAGSRDFEMDPKTIVYRDINMKGLLDTMTSSNVHYLHHSSITLEIDGKPWCIFDSPFTPRYQAWAFQDKQDSDLWHAMPPHVDIVVTHGPPQGILDRTWRRGTLHHGGSPALLSHIKQRGPRLHIFGHLHEDAGKVVEEDGTWFINAATGFAKSTDRALRAIVCDMEYTC